jgi:hypothetical protein
MVSNQRSLAVARSKPHRGTTIGYYAEIDMSLELSSVCIVDGNGKNFREGKVWSEPAALITWFSSLALAMTRVGLGRGLRRNGFRQR